MSSVVDPHARADFFLAASPEGLEVEEGYITFTTLPKSFLLKVGKMRAQFGKVNTLHTHMMPSADRPLVTQNLVGGEEGISDSGVSLSKLFDNPLLFLEATAEVYSGDSEVFQSESRSRLNYVGRLRVRDLTESTNLDVGTSIAWGRPTRWGRTRSAASSASMPRSGGRCGAPSTPGSTPGRSWSGAARISGRAEPVRALVPAWPSISLPGAGISGRASIDRGTRDAALRDNGGSVFLTFWPSEFSQIRGQCPSYALRRRAPGARIPRATQFRIGAHGAHVF